MRLPSDTSAWSSSVRYGVYLCRRLLAAGEDEEAGKVKSTTLEVRDLGRAWEDCDVTVQEASADRDAASASLRSLAREARRTLLARADRAEKKPPYTDVFPHGLGEYTLCKVDEIQATYKQLRERIQTSLPAEDVLRTDLAPRIDQAIAVHLQAETALEDVRNTAQRGREALQSARAGWKTLMEQVYGMLVYKFGKEEAEDFFPKHRTSSAAEEKG